MLNHFTKALQNIIRHGDSDICPFPFERALFEHDMEKTLDVLQDYYDNTAHALASNTPQNIITLSQVGYHGFREADLIAPFWNAFYLGLVISIAEKIEQQRIPTDENTIFSYRYGWNEEKATPFKHTTWSDYKKQCVIHAKTHPYVLQTDIVNFYPSINHQQLQQDLTRIDTKNIAATRIMQVLHTFSNQLAFGLPVGGPASRILAELTLNETDKLLKSENFVFCRYADDFTIFCQDKTDAYKKLILLVQILAKQQLNLHKDKTKMMSSADFLEENRYIDPDSTGQQPSNDLKTFLLTFHFNPYIETDTAEQGTWNNAVNEMDIVALLKGEVSKSSIDKTLTKQIISAVKALPIDQQVEAIQILLDDRKMLLLSPVFSNIIRLVRSQYEKLPVAAQDHIDQRLVALFDNDSFLTRIEVNTSYLLQILAYRHTKEKEDLLIRMYNSGVNPYIKRQIIVAMANWGCREWLQSLIKHYASMTTWERSAFQYASYFLGDEGAQWRGQQAFSPEEAILNDWCTTNIQSNKTILV